MNFIYILGTITYINEYLLGTVTYIKIDNISSIVLMNVHINLNSIIK